MRRIIAIALIALGAAGLILGRLGETAWAPATEETAVADLKDPGAAVLIDPGVVYAGGHEGTLKITAPKPVHVIATTPDVATAYLGGARYTEVTGVPSWSTLSTKAVQPQGEGSVPDPATTELWPSLPEAKTSIEMPLAVLWKNDGGAKPAQPYPALLLVGDGSAPAASQITVTWPVERSNAWVPYAYAIGALLAVMGLALFAADYSARSARRQADDDAAVDAAHAEIDDDAVIGGGIAEGAPAHRSGSSAAASAPAESAEDQETQR